MVSLFNILWCPKSRRHNEENLKSAVLKLRLDTNGSKNHEVGFNGLSFSAFPSPSNCLYLGLRNLRKPEVVCLCSGA
jgi:hypothetical protein